MTVANLITSIRIILTPVFIIYLINGEFKLALIVFVISGVSDGVDGLVARIFNQKSTLGTYLDPLADKLLLVTAFVALAVMGMVPSWVTVLVISRDVMILLGVLILFLNRLEISIHPSIISKINTCLQICTVIVILSKSLFSFPERFYFYLFSITALFTISSGLHYMHYWFKVMSENSENSSNSCKD